MKMNALQVAGALLLTVLAASATGPAFAQSRVYPEGMNCALLPTQDQQTSCQAQAPSAEWRGPHQQSPIPHPTINNRAYQQQSPYYPPANAPGGIHQVKPIQPRVGGPTP